MLRWTVQKLKDLHPEWRRHGLPLPLNVFDIIYRTKDALENRDTYILENSSQNKIL